MAAARPSRARPIRKRYADTRRKAKRTRPKSPAPTNGWLIAELSMLTGVSVRTLRHYITRGLLQPLALRGTATRYSRRELLRLLKMLQLKSESVGRVTLSALKRALDAHSNAELEAWVLTQRLSPELARALNSEAKVAPPGTGTFSASPALPADKEKDATDAKTAALERLAVETWHRIPLLPGLELMLSATASAAVQGVALRLYSDVMGPRPS